VTKKPDKWERRVHFEPPREVAVMSIDGTWRAEAVLMDISAKEARIRSPILRAELPEFFLMLTTFGSPVFRRCARAWVNGPEMGLTFAKAKIGAKAVKGAPQESSGLSD
jgi:hypothetical protein